MIVKDEFNKFDFFFSILDNRIFIKQGFVWRTVSISPFYGVSLKTTTLVRNVQLITLLNITTVKNSSKKFLARILRNTLVWMDNYLEKGFFAEIGLQGLGFRLDKVTDSIYYINVGLASGFYIFIPKYIRMVVSRKTRSIFFFSLDLNQLNNILASIMLIRGLNPYRVAGLVQAGKVIRLRTGKQR